MITVVLGIGVATPESDRGRNLAACLRSLEHQTLERDAYRLVLMEQGATPQFERHRYEVDEYRFVYNPKLFNRSWVLNIVAWRLPPGVLCTFDSDMIVPPDFLRRGLLAWQCGAKAIRPFKEVVYLNQASTELVRKRAAEGLRIDCYGRDYSGDLHDKSKGGCIWIDTDTYREVGGHDERFEGWGVEDNEFYDRLGRHTTIVNLGGRLLHMYHERSMERRPEVRESAVLLKALESGLLPPQRGPLGDPDRFKHLPPTPLPQAPPVRYGFISASGPTFSPDQDEIQTTYAGEVLAEAGRICRQTSRLQVGTARDGRLGLRALFARRQKRDDVALASLRAAARLASGERRILDALAEQLIAAGHLPDALRVALRALRLAPDRPDAYRLASHALRESGGAEGGALPARRVDQHPDHRHREPCPDGQLRHVTGRITIARLLLQEALLVDLLNVHTASALAEAFEANGETDKAAGAHDLAWRLDRENPVLSERLGTFHLRQGAWKDALSHFERAFEQLSAQERDDPGADAAATDTPAAVPPWRPARPPLESGRAWRCDLHRGFGELRLATGHTDESERAVRRALKNRPKDAEASALLARVLDRLERPDDAAAAWSATGDSLARANRLPEALTAYTDALARDPKNLKALLGLGEIHAELGQLQDAVDCFERARALSPEHEQVDVQLAHVTYKLGDIDRAWRHFDVFDGPLAREARAFEQPRWDGGPLDGRTVLAIAEPALGDAIQTLRYLPFLRDAGARIVLQTPARLVPIVRRLGLVDLVIAEGAPTPAFDVYVPLQLMPLLHPPCRWPVPPMPADLRADERLVRRWRARLDAVGGGSRSNRGSSSGGGNGATSDALPTLNVGLCWTGHPRGINARARFTRLGSFAPLAETPGVRFFSLQMGAAAIELLAPPEGLRTTHLQDDTCSLDDTAALIACLDVVVTIDTSIAHLSAAMGRPTWMALPLVADWRWRDDVERTAFYPSMRIFRQTARGDWDGVFRRIREALCQEAAWKRELSCMPEPRVS